MHLQMQRALLASKQDVVVGMSSSHVLPKCHYDGLLSHRIEVYLHGSELQEQKHQACLRQTVNKCREETATILTSCHVPCFSTRYMVHTCEH